MATGVAIVLVLPMPEVLNLSHRLYVMHRSRMAAERTGADISDRRCCRISSASNKPPVLPRTPWQRTTPRRTRSIDWNGNERQIDQR